MPLFAALDLKNNSRPIQTKQLETLATQTRLEPIILLDLLDQEPVKNGDDDLATSLQSLSSRYQYLCFVTQPCWQWSLPDVFSFTEEEIIREGMQV